MELDTSHPFGTESPPRELTAFLIDFNTGRYHEAHDALEPLWLQQRSSAPARFYQALIQLAGAFVLLRKHSPSKPRIHPACRLLALAREKIQPFGSLHAGLNARKALDTIDSWLHRLTSLAPDADPWEGLQPPRLEFEPQAPSHPGLPCKSPGVADDRCL